MYAVSSTELTVLSGHRPPARTSLRASHPEYIVGGPAERVPAAGTELQSSDGWERQERRRYDEEQSDPGDELPPQSAPIGAAEVVTWSLLTSGCRMVARFSELGG